MSATPQKAKAPFEKIRSLVERRKLFEGVIRDGGEILCKADGDLLFNMNPKFIEQDAATQKFFLKGELSPLGPDSKAFQTLKNENTSKHEIVGNFSVGEQRYFLKGQLVVLHPWVFVPLECEVFHFQRRSSLRLALPSDFQMIISIQNFDKNNLFNLARVADISAGGAKIYFSGAESTFGIQDYSRDPGLKVGTVFRAIVKPPTQKNIECQCEVKHLKEEVIDGEKYMCFGISFVNLSSSQQNRLTAMSLDLQRKLLND